MKPGGFFPTLWLYPRSNIKQKLLLIFVSKSEQFKQGERMTSTSALSSRLKFEPSLLAS